MVEVRCLDLDLRRVDVEERESDGDWGCENDWEARRLLGDGASQR